MRAQFIDLTTKGLSWQASSNFHRNTAWAAYYAPVRTTAGPVVNENGAGQLSPTGGADHVYYNYKTKIKDLGLQGIVTINNIRFHKQKSGIVLYGGAGIGATLYDAMVNTGNSQGSYEALFNSIFNQYGVTSYKNRRSVIKALKAGMDKSYETQAESETGRFPHMGKYTLKPSGTVLFGAAIKLSTRINLALEDRWTFVKTDLLDGQQWQEQPMGDAVMTRDFDSYNYLSLGLNFNLGAKSVEPLWWLNPLDYAYSEISNPKHMKLPKTKFIDSDGDGVIDELDREPNTPAGCAVDTHGVSLDTDGDGVPDCRDKQKITPTECQPVDADGVGHCPDPACCKNRDTVKIVSCPTDYPSISFKGVSTSLSADAKAMLATVAAKLKANPTCTIAIVGHPGASKAAQAVCAKRNDAIKAYIVETLGVSADRVSFDCTVGSGDVNTVDISAK